MAQINDDIFDVIGDMSFLPQAKKDENLHRISPKMGRGESIFRYSWATILVACTLTFLIYLFMFGTQSYYFPSNINGSYGVWGIIVTALMAISFCVAHIFGYYNDAVLSLDKDEKKAQKNYAISTTLYYVSFALLYTTIFSTVLRPFVFQQYFVYDNWFLDCLGIFIYILMMLAVVVGIVLNFVKPKVAKFYNYGALALGYWVVVCFTALLTRTSYSMSSNYGIMLFIFGGVFADLALIFLLFQKKSSGCRTMFHVLLSGASICDCLAILIYGIVYLGA